MKLSIRLFIQKHQNRTYTIAVPVLPGISAYGPTLEECKQEIAEALEKRLSEIEPEFLHAVELHPTESLEKVTVTLYPTDHHGRRRRETFKLTVSLMLRPEEDGPILVTAPRLRRPPLSFYINNKEELLEIAQHEIAQYFHGESLERIAFYQASRREMLDSIEVRFTPRKPADMLEEEEEAGFWGLKASGINLAAQAAEGQLRRTFRRDREVEEVLTTIASERRPSILLVGESGVGKTTIIHEVARRIRRKECPEALHDRQVWGVSGDSLIAGCSFIGEWQDKLNDIVREVRKKRHILVVDDVASLAEAGRWSKSDDNMADFLKPHIQSGDVILIGEATPERKHRVENLAAGFAAQFRTLVVAPTSEADTLSILTSVSRELERGEDVRIEPSALEAAVELTNRFLPYRVQPGKAIALIEQTASDTQHAAAASHSTTRPVLTRKETIATFTRQTGLPEFIISDGMPLNLEDVRSHFADRVIGQDAAVQSMTDLVAVIKAGLSDPHKPLGSFLFIGPTGVGKTQLAKTLAAYLFGDERRVIRFDMSEYSDPAAVYRLIGNPVAGRDGGEGELTRRVRDQPFCVLLLDEFEKAASEIYDVFLQVLGEGRLTDASGRTTSFQNAIILMTSNLGASAREQRGIGLNRGGTAQPAGAALGGNSESDGDGDTNTERTDTPGTASGAGVVGMVGTEGTGASSAYWQRKVEDYFRPEFVNRLDQIIAFLPLSESAMRRIATRELGDVLLREGLVRRNVLVEIDDNVVDILLERGFHATYGARPLKRAIEQLVVLPLARFLASRARPGADLIRLRSDGNHVVLSSSHFAQAERSSEVVLSTPGMALAGEGKRQRMDDHGLVEGFAELRRKLQDWYERDAVAEMRNERAGCLAHMNRPTFWDDGDAARATLGRFYFLDRLLKRLQQLADRAEYLEELSGLVHRQRDARYRTELAESYEQLYRDYAFLEVELLTAHITHNHRAVLLLRRVGFAPKDKENESEPWLTQLASIYTRWSTRKGYEVELYALHPLPEPHQTETTKVYPYEWKLLNADNLDTLLEELAGLSDTNEIAIGLNGTNVYGFLKGEAGMHRRNDRRASGERVQHLVDVAVAAPGEEEIDEWLDMLIERRREEEHKRAALSKRERAKLAQPAEPEIVRVYQFEGERVVRDMRTHIRVKDISLVLDGRLDDFILAYLRDEEVKEAWDE